MSSSTGVASDELASKVLFPPTGTGALKKRLPQLLQRLCEATGFTKAQLLSLRCGVLFAEQLYPRHQVRVRAEGSEVEAWQNAQQGTLFGPDFLIIPVPRLSPDVLADSSVLAAVLLTSPGASDDLERLNLARNRTLLRSIGIYIADQLDATSNARLARAHRHLSSLQGRIVLSADMCYQVAHEIRTHLGFIGWCGVFRAQVSSLESVAVLPAESSRASTKTLSRKDPIPVGELSSLLSGQHGEETEPSQVFTFSSEHTSAGLRRKHSNVVAVRNLSAQVITLIENIVREVNLRVRGTNRGWLLCPLIWRRKIFGEQEVIGVLVIASESDQFSATEAIEASELAAHCIPALARDAAVESEFELLDSASAVDPEVPLENNEAFRRLLDVLCESFRVHRNADIVTIIPFESRTGRMRLDMVAASPNGANVKPADPLPSDEGVLRKILEAGEFEWHSEIPSIPFSDDSFVSRNGIKSFYAIALQSTSGTAERPSPLGVLFVDYKTQKRGRNPEAKDQPSPGFTDAEKRWIRRYATIAGTYLSVQTRTAQNHSNDQAVLKVYRGISSDSSVESTLHTIFEAGAELVGATAGVLAVPANEHNGLSILCHKNLDQTRIAAIPFGRGVTGMCAKLQKPIYISDTSDKGSWPSEVAPLPWVPGSKSEFAVPLVSHESGDYLIGVLDLENQHAPNAFGPAEQHALQHLANASVLAIELTEWLQRLEKLELITRKIRVSSTAASIYEVLLGDAAAVLHAFAGSIRVLDPNGEYLQSVARVGPPGKLSEVRFRLGEGVTGYALQHRKTVTIKDVTDALAIAAEYRGLSYLASREETRSEIAVPLIWRGDMLGVLNFEHTQKGALLRFRTFLEGLAHQAAQSLYVVREATRERFLRYDEAVETISAFARSVHHNVAAPLDRIQKLCAMTYGLNMDAEAAETVVQIRKAAEEGYARAAELVEMAPHLGQQVHPVKPIFVVKSVIDALRPRLPNFQFAVINDCADHVIVRARDKVLAWCFTQIVENSYKHGGTKVSVRLRKVERGSVQATVGEDEYIEITFEDDGPGVPEDCLEEVFAWKKERLKPRGRGEAMALCRLYIQHMNGQAWCSRSPSGALATHIALPLALGA